MLHILTVFKKMSPRVICLKYWNTTIILVDGLTYQCQTIDSQVDCYKDPSSRSAHHLTHQKLTLVHIILHLLARRRKISKWCTHLRSISWKRWMSFGIIIMKSFSISEHRTNKQSISISSFSHQNLNLLAHRGLIQLQR